MDDWPVPGGAGEASGITDDLNEYSDSPCYILDLTGRLATVSILVRGIVSGLSVIEVVERSTNWSVTWMMAVQRHHETLFDANMSE